MNLTDLMTTILASTKDDWNRIPCWGGFTGPSYKDRFFTDPQFNNSHSEILAYKNDLSISIAFGLECGRNYKADWAKRFYDDAITSEFVDIFYNNSLVFRSKYIIVDSGSSKMPIPSSSESEVLVVERDYHSFIKFLQEISPNGDPEMDFDYYFKKTKIKIIDKDWY